MKIPAITLIDEAGAVAYEGSLAEFLRVNREGIDFKAFIADLRQGIRSSPPEPAMIGGGAAPAFWASL